MQVITDKTVLKMTLINSGIWAIWAFILAGAVLYGLPQGAVDASNAQWLDVVQETQHGDLILLAEIFAFLEILSSIEIGAEFLVSANVEIGQALSAFGKAIEAAVFAVLIAGMTGKIWMLVLLAASAIAGPACIVTILLIGAGFAARAVRLLRSFVPVLRYCAIVAATIFTTSWIVVPYTMNASGWVYDAASGAIFQDHENVVPHLHKSLDPSVSAANPLGFWKSKRNIQSAFQLGHDALPHKIGGLVRYVMTHLMLALIMIVFIPVTAMIGILAVWRGLWAVARDPVLRRQPMQKAFGL